MTHEQLKDILEQKFDCECSVTDIGLRQIGNHWGFVRESNNDILTAATIGRANEIIRGPQINYILRQLEISKSEFYE